MQRVKQCATLMIVWLKMHFVLMCTPELLYCDNNDFFSKIAPKRKIKCNPQSQTVMTIPLEQIVICISNRYGLFNAKVRDMKDIISFRPWSVDSQDGGPTDVPILFCLWKNRDLGNTLPKHLAHKGFCHGLVGLHGTQIFFIQALAGKKLFGHH